MKIKGLAQKFGVSRQTIRVWREKGLTDFSDESVCAFRGQNEDQRQQINEQAKIIADKFGIGLAHARKHAKNGTIPRIKTKINGPRHWKAPSTHAVWYLAEIARDLKSFPDWGVLWDREQRQARCREYGAAKWVQTPREKRDQINARIREYRKTDEAKAKRREYKRKRFEQEPELRVQDSLRARLSKFTDGKTSRGVAALIGCSWQEFRDHLERQFAPGMSWQNYGSAWHIDHIIPCSKFDHSNPREVNQCWHFTNLRPLSAAENVRKGAKIELPQMHLLLNR